MTKDARGALAILAALSFPVVAAGGGCTCGGNSGTDTGLDAGTDSAPPGTDAASDGGESGPPPIGDAATASYVMDTFTIPASMSGVGFDLTGDGMVDNQLAEILAGVSTLAGPMFDAQVAIDMALADGSLLYLLLADGLKNLVDDPAIAVSSVFGEDTDLDPANNFAGGALLRIAPGQMPAVLLGPVTAGRFHVGPTDLPLLIPLGTTTITTTLTGALMEADVSATALANGILGGAVTTAALEADVYPALALLVNDELDLLSLLVPGGPVPCTADVAGDRTSMDCGAMEECTASNAADMGFCVPGGDAFVMFWLAPAWDANGDGVLTAAEIAASPVIDLIVTPDVDVDGDGTADAVSFAVQFSAVDCVLVP